MKGADSNPFHVGQTVLHQDGKTLHPVTFVCCGPRVGKAAGKDTVTTDPQNAIVRDENGDLLTVRLAELLQPESRNAPV